jgi:uncharacterized protein (DUF488 family)
MGDPAVYTLGYEGLSIDEFFGLLTENGILHLIDVRRDPVSRRYGFHKKTLSNLCEGYGIEYTHLPELGIESKYRKGLKTEADRKALLSRYEAETISREKEAVALLSRLMSERPCVLVCVESDPNRCHRSILAKAVAEMSGLSIRHLKAVKDP